MSCLLFLTFGAYTQLTESKQTTASTLRSWQHVPEYLQPLHNVEACNADQSSPSV